MAKRYVRAMVREGEEEEVSLQKWCFIYDIKARRPKEKIMKHCY